MPNGQSEHVTALPIVTRIVPQRDPPQGDDPFVSQDPSLAYCARGKSAATRTWAASRGGRNRSPAARRTAGFGSMCVGLAAGDDRARY